MTCLVITQQVKDLAAKLVGETEASTKTAVELWQAENGKTMDTYPTAKELSVFIKNTRREDTKDDTTISNSSRQQELMEETERIISAFDAKVALNPLKIQQVLLDYNTQTRKDRTTLLATLFSQTLDEAMDKTKADLEAIINNPENSQELIDDMRVELESLTRLDILSKVFVNPRGVFSKIKSGFEAYTKLTDEQRVNIELTTLKRKSGFLKLSEEKQISHATKVANHKNSEYKKLLRNFEVLAADATFQLVFTEGIKISLEGAAQIETDTDIEDDGTSQVAEDKDMMAQEESIKEGWMTGFRSISSHDSLSQNVRKFIRTIPKLVEKNGKLVRDTDDLGNYRFLNADEVHATLMDGLRNMIDEDDFFTSLQELSRTKPWVKQVINSLNDNITLTAQFYQDFRKDFTSYWIQKTSAKEDGVLKAETIKINEPEGTYYLLEQWRANYEAGNQISDDSVYDKDGTYSKENAAKGLIAVNALNNIVNNLENEEILEFFQDDDNIEKVNDLLKMLGIEVNPTVLKDTLTQESSSPMYIMQPKIFNILSNLNIIFSGISKGELDANTSRESIVTIPDMLNTYGTAFNSIAMDFAEVAKDAIESSAREGDKTYYSHTVPNYLGKLMKQLKNVLPNKLAKDQTKYSSYFDEFIDTQFKKFDMFYSKSEDRFRNVWLKMLVESETIRKGFNHKVLLNRDKKEYSDWDALDYTSVLFEEFFSEPASKGTTQWAWYHVPILSDTASAEFIRFIRFVDDKITGDSYQKQMTPHFIDLIMQEYDRINLVIARHEKWKANKSSIEPIAAYDITENKDGSIKSMGGAEFKFLPYLNTYKVAGRPFLEVLGERIADKEESPTALYDLLNTAVADMMDESFENAYAEWNSIGMLATTESGKYKYLKGITAFSKANKSIIDALTTLKDMLGEGFSPRMQYALDSLMSGKLMSDRNYAAVVEEIKTTMELNGFNLEDKDNATLINKLNTVNHGKEELRNYFWNSTLATSQIIQLTATDLAYYKNFEDFQKRFKEVHAPASRMYTKSKYGRTEEKTIYLKDEVIVSVTYDNIKSILNEKVNKGELSAMDRDSILNKYKEVNTADAQAYRSLSSYRAILDMSGQWDEKMQQAFEHFQDGTWDISDFDTIWQTKKPYLYTQHGIDNGIDGGQIKMGVQHKNSEFLLLAAHTLVAGKMGMSDKLRAINDFMEKHEIDVVQFESAVKVGKQGLIDINNLNDYKSVIEELEAKTGFNTGAMNPNIVHTLSYEDYGIQTSTPEHIIDAVQLVGTQIRKLIMADIADDAMIDVNGKKMSKNELLDFYNKINTENILQKFQEVDKIFTDPKEVEKILLEEVLGNPRYTQDMVQAVTLNEDGEFTIPLFDPIVSMKVQALLNSVIKNRVTKQKIRGGALIQVTNYGLTEELNIRYNDAEGNLLMTQSEWNGIEDVEDSRKDYVNSMKSKYNTFEEYSKATATKNIAYFEVMMPAYSREFYQELMEEGSHVLDINKLPEELRKGIGYRVPTEDKYSMMPFKIKGFLPQQNGSSIMLPADITTIAGSDFDVDKLYVMLPEFKAIKQYDKARFIKDLIKEQVGDSKMDRETYNELFFNIKDAINNPEEGNENQANIRKTYQANKQNYYLGTKFEKVEYDYSKEPKDNTREQRNNALIDSMWGVLTNEDTASKILNPGGFDNLKDASKIVTILESVSESDIQNFFNSRESVYSLLSKANSKILDKLLESKTAVINPLSPATQVKFQQQNMVGAALIGIYANHNANHALLQSTKIAVNNFGSFTLNGKTLTSLHAVKNAEKQFISKNNSGFLAASVDNAKDPILGKLLQNSYTANISMLLSRLGYEANEIAVFMKQPIIVEIVNTYMREGREGTTKDGAFKKIMADYTVKSNLTGRLNYDNFKANKFNISDLADNIVIAKEMEGITDRSQTSDYRKVEFYKNQVAVGYLFQRISATADALVSVVNTTRSDTQNGAAGPHISTTISKTLKVEDLAKSILENPKFPLSNALLVIPGLGTNNEETMREDFYNAELPYLQAFYTLGVEAVNKLFAKYFPQYSVGFTKVIDDIRQLTKLGTLNEKTMNSVYNDLFAYIASSLEFFGTETIEKDGVKTLLTSEQKRQDYINKFPAHFLEVKNNNPDIAALSLIDRLVYFKPNKKNPLATIKFTNVGKLSATLRNQYTRDWEYLLTMNNPVANKLAVELFMYSYFRSGFAFGPNSFIHLAPNNVRMAIPGYIEKLRSLMSSKDQYNEFVDQYFMNHLDNRSLVPEIAKDSSVSIMENDNVLDTVEVSISEENSSPTSDYKLVLSTIEVEGETLTSYVKFFGAKTPKGMVYYKMASEDGYSAVYERVDPLGYTNGFLEYEYGVEASAMKSVIPQNDRNYVNPINQQGADNFGFMEDFDMDNYELAEIPQFDNVPFEASGAFQQAANDIYGLNELNNAVFEGYSALDTFDSIPSDDEVLDDAGKPICKIVTRL